MPYERTRRVRKEKNIDNILPRKIRCGSEDLNHWGYNRDQWRTSVIITIQFRIPDKLNTLTV
jgi:hypothetical protein